jgi:hypothetical protein
MNDPIANGVADPVLVDWDRIHEAIQAVLSGLARSVKERWPEVVSRPGRTSTNKLPLFSYRTFELMDSPEADAVVVGLDFQPSETTVRIRGDLCGEESGRIFYDTDCETEAEKTHGKVLAAALDITGKLTAQADRIREALTSLQPSSQSS